jgi:hypothetical protein
MSDAGGAPHNGMGRGSRPRVRSLVSVDSAKRSACRLTFKRIVKDYAEMKSRLLFVVAFSFTVVAGCQRSEPEEKRMQSRPPNPAQPTDVPAEPWASKQPQEWPQLVLTNLADMATHLLKVRVRFW